MAIPAPTASPRRRGLHPSVIDAEATVLPRCRGRFSPAHRWGNCSQPRGEISEIGPEITAFSRLGIPGALVGPDRERVVPTILEASIITGANAMLKLIAMGLTSVLGLGLAGLFQDRRHRRGGGPPPPKAKGKKRGDPGTSCERPTTSSAGPLRHGQRTDGGTHQATGPTGRRTSTAGPSERREQGDLRRAREIGTAAHDLARAVDHARNAASTRPTGPGPAPSSRRLRSRRHRRADAP